MTRKTRINLFGWLGIILGIAIVVLISFILYNHTVNLLTNNLRVGIEGIARTFAAIVDPNDVAELQQESDWTKPAWSRVINQLLSVEQNNDNILFAYIFKKSATDPIKMEFVADSHSLNPYANTDQDPSNNVDANRDGIIEPDGPDYLQWPGQPYEEPPEGTFRAYDGPTTSKELYEDSFGKVITGYAPIRQGDNIIAVVAFDIKADDFFTITRQTLLPFLFFIAVLIAIILLMFWFIIRLWNRQIAIVEAADELKSQFLSFASHQVKAPMAVVKGFAEIIRDGTYGAVPDKVKETSEKIIVAANRMIDLVANLLDMRKIEEGKMNYNFEEMDLIKLTKEIVDELRPLAEKKGLDLSIDIEIDKDKATVKADAQKFKQTILNLIDNSIKYTPSGWVKVSITNDNRQQTADQSKRILISVSDSGLGISAELLPKLFQQFSRDKEVGKKILGIGLGLFIAKQIIKDHGGEIWVESAGEGKGSQFYVSIKKVNS